MEGLGRASGRAEAGISTAPQNAIPAGKKSGFGRRRNGALSDMFPRCGNARCGSGAIRLWRNRRAPIFEGRWACSRDCLEAMVEAAIRREARTGGAAGTWTHRIPLSLMLLNQGSISEAQLREVAGQKNDSGGDAVRLEEWLLTSGVLSEAALTRAISAQWGCPVFTLSDRCSEALTSALPPFLAEALGALPVRVSGLLYLAFAEKVDRSLSYAVEHITGFRVAAGIARGSEFRREQDRFLACHAPKTRFLDAEQQGALVQGIVSLLEEKRPMEARLARVHDLWWLRVWQEERGGGGLPDCEAVEDWLATSGGRAAEESELEETAGPPIRKAEGSGASCRE
jgi:hypothetical protein